VALGMVPAVVFRAGSRFAPAISMGRARNQSHRFGPAQSSVLFTNGGRIKDREQGIQQQ